MSEQLSRRLSLLASAEHRDLLRHCRHGIEKESLRVDAEGRLALTPHPASLGAALTHPHITTDYSEALLEFITSPAESPAAALDELDQLQRFAQQCLGQDEYLWNNSMPCLLPEVENAIPIAEYGSSHIGQLKHIYRRGLALRYGKAMQCIAGIHYNFSLPEALWPLLRDARADDGLDERQWQDACYMGLLRNFRRYSWLLMYLFGASPAVARNFLYGRSHNLDALDDDSLYLPWATSLRMSDLGYQNNTQSGLTPCYDSLDSYLHSLRKAVSTPWPAYAEAGTHDSDGQWQQLSTNVLQIENEYYSSIRPKRVAESGERPIQALGARGVQYVEVRCIDINPFHPRGIDRQQARFIDAFLLFCALEDSPLFTAEECQACADNFALTVREGRRPWLMLDYHGYERPLKDWGLELLGEIERCAALFDQAHGNSLYQQAVGAQRRRMLDARLTPSARVLQALREQRGGFFQFARQLAARQAGWLRQQPLDAAGTAAFARMAAESHAAQQAIEASDRVSFDAFVDCYMQQTGPQVSECARQMSATPEPVATEAGPAPKAARKRSGKSRKQD